MWSGSCNHPRLTAWKTVQDFNSYVDHIDICEISLENVTRVTPPPKGITPKYSYHLDGQARRLSRKQILSVLAQTNTIKMRQKQ
jgi:hypothetical protein